MHRQTKWWRESVRDVWECSEKLNICILETAERKLIEGSSFSLPLCGKKISVYLILIISQMLFFLPLYQTAAFIVKMTCD